MMVFGACIFFHLFFYFSVLANCWFGDTQKKVLKLFGKHISILWKAKKTFYLPNTTALEYISVCKHVYYILWCIFYRSWPRQLFSSVRFWWHEWRVEVLLKPIGRTSSKRQCCRFSYFSVNVWRTRQFGVSTYSTYWFQY